MGPVSDVKSWTYKVLSSSVVKSWPPVVFCMLKIVQKSICVVVCPEPFGDLTMFLRMPWLGVRCHTKNLALSLGLAVLCLLVTNPGYATSELKLYLCFVGIFSMFQ